MEGADHLGMRPEKDANLAVANLAASLKDPTAEFVEIGARDLDG